MDILKVVEKNKNKVLIEHNNQRFLLTWDLYNQYQNGKLTPDDLTMSGIPVSVQWSDFIDLSHLTSESIEFFLHQRGIHTIDDLLNNMQKVNGAIFAAMGITGSNLYKKVKQNQRVGE